MPRLPGMWGPLIDVTVMAARLRGTGFRACAALLSSSTDQAGGPPGDLDEFWAGYVRTSRLPWSTCLSRAAAACARLRARGVAATLVIGTATRPGFSAHAWLRVGAREFGASPVHEPMIQSGRCD